METFSYSLNYSTFLIVIDPFVSGSGSWFLDFSDSDRDFDIVALPSYLPTFHLITSFPMSKRRRTFPKGFDYVRWQVERERCQISDLLPRTPFKEATPVGASLDGVLKKIGITFSADENRIQQNWIEIVGPDIARRTMPGTLTRGTLTVFVKGSVWLAELKRNGPANLIQRINEAFGAETVKRINLLAAPTGYRPAASKKPEC